MLKLFLSKKEIFNLTLFFQRGKTVYSLPFLVAHCITSIGICNDLKYVLVTYDINFAL